MKKLLLTIGTATATVAPLATTIACGSDPIKNGTVVTYGPDLDMALALRMDVTSTVERANATSAGVLDLIAATGKYDDALAAIENENRPYWDTGEIDEEYWLSLNADTLIAEYWVGAEKRERITEIIPESVFFDYNAGVQGEEFKIQIADDTGAAKTYWGIANKNDEIYGDPSDYWQMREMAAFVRESAASLDSQDHISGKAELAEEIIERTDERWLEIRKKVTGDSSATLPTGSEWSSVLSSDPSADGLNLLSIGLSTLDALDPSIGTPSNMKELYVNSGYNYPHLNTVQVNALASQGGNWAGINSEPGYVKSTSQIANGFSFGRDMEPAFFSEYDNAIDKMVIGLPDAIRNNSTKKELFDELKDNSVIQSMFDPTMFTIDNVMFVSPYLSGRITYNFRQPISQNSFMDQMATEWLGMTEENNNDFFTWW